MRHKTTLVFVMAAALATIAPVTAQAQDKRWHVSLGGGWTAPNSEVSDRFGQGYNFNFGVDVAINPVISIEGVYSFNGLGEKNITLPVTAQPLGTGGVPTQFFSSMNMQYGTGSVLFQKPEGTVKPFGLVGMGVYYRPVEVSTPGVGYVPGWCDPWWYVCYPGGFVPVENIVGDRSSTDFGMTFGGGVKFGVVYAELRYHYIWGPEITPQDFPNLPQVSPPVSENVGKKANGQFFQTTFGVRF
jgi:opacity protein-like surface antigen